MSRKTQAQTKPDGKKHPQAPADRTTHSEGTSPHPDQYGASITAKFIRMVSRATNEEIAFLYRFVDTANEEVYSVPEAALVTSAPEFGLGFLVAHIEDVKESAEDLRAVFLMLNCDEDPVNCALRQIFSVYRQRGSRMSLEDMLYAVETAMNEENASLESAGRILRRRPWRLRDQLRDVVRKNPGLLQEGENAR